MRPYHLPIPVSVNVSAIQFRDAGFLKTASDILGETDLESQYLELELTEGVTMQATEATASLMQSLKNLGVGLSINDFGTGYSTLSYLKRFPIDILKIDQSFIRDITTDPDDAAITLAIIKWQRACGNA